MSEQRRFQQRALPKDLLTQLKNNAYHKMTWAQKRRFPLFEEEQRVLYEKYRKLLEQLEE